MTVQLDDVYADGDQSVSREAAAFDTPSDCAESHKAYWLEWKETTVAGRRACYGQGGDGPVLVFLHGWGLDHRSLQEVSFASSGGGCANPGSGPAGLRRFRGASGHGFHISRPG
jgi:pimeloyl-ACP methyl ester carboxylesterase